MLNFQSVPGVDSEFIAVGELFLHSHFGESDGMWSPTLRNQCLTIEAAMRTHGCDCGSSSCFFEGLTVGYQSTS